MIDAHPRQFQLFRERGHARANAGRWSDAAGDFEKASELGSDSVKDLCLAAIARLRGGDAGPAMELAKRALEISPGNPDSLSTLGTACYRLGQLEAAVIHLRKATAVEGRQSHALDRAVLAMAEHRLGRTSEAREELELARRLGQELLRRKPTDFQRTEDRWAVQARFEILLAEAEVVLGGGK